MAKLIYSCLVIGLLIFSASSRVGAQDLGYKVRKIVTTQDQSPFDFRFDSFQISTPASINIKGEVAFIGTVEGRSSTPSIFFISSSNSRVVASVGDTAPVGGKYTRFSNVLINDNGQICFQAALDNDMQAIFLTIGTTTKKIVVTGEKSPEGETYSQILAFAVNDNGDIAFVATLLESNSEAVYLRTGEKTTRIVGSGDQLPEGGKFVNVSCITSVSINNRQAVTFSVNVGEDEAEGAIFTYFNGALARIVDEEATSPLDGKFGDFCKPFINSSGNIIFKANGNREEEGAMAIRPLEEEEKNEGVFMASGDVVNKIITGGDPFPGGGEFEIVTQRGLDDDGRVFFDNSVLEGRAATGIYSILNGKVSTIASLGGPAPEGGIFKLVFGNTLSVNKSGVSVFVGLLDNEKTGLFIGIPDNLLPQITSASYKGGKLTITGKRLGPKPVININGSTISASKLTSQTDTQLILTGSKKGLGLSKKNQNIVTVMVDNISSDRFSFSLK